MSKKINKSKFNINKIGLIIAAVGVGIILCVILPFWGWALALGAGLIYIGWSIMENLK